MRHLAAYAVVLLLALTGCPQAQDTTTSDVTPVISTSATNGPAAPFLVNFSASGSSSVNGGTLTYSWDFDDGSTSASESVAHTFVKPGLYVVTLRATDPTGETAVSSVDIRVKGSGAVAVIGADVTSGPTPLTVQFDGTHSDGQDDVIRNYYWDFGDAATSESSQPSHTYYVAGQYTVTLRVVTAGGVDAQTTTTIDVSVRNGALQFDGAQFATLSVSATAALSRCTFEAWVNADAEGGNVVTVGPGDIAIELIPASNAIRLRSPGGETSMTANSLANRWRHIAIVYDTGASSSDPNQADPNQTSTGRCTVYLDGAAIGNGPASRGVDVNPLTLGNGMRGKIAEVRFWSAARTRDQILTNKNQRIAGTQANLLGAWPLYEGSGQTLSNRAGGPTGTLGASVGVESIDPAWSAEGPPF